MAVDTANKRRSLMVLALPCGRVMPTLDGGFSTAAERAQLAYLYAFGSAAPVLFPAWWGAQNNQRVGPVIVT